MTDDLTPIRAVLIAGPTASGKSSLALALARRIGGIVVNADASQVYGDLRILTARPSAEDESVAPHALYGHVDAAERYGVGRWLDDVRGAIHKLSTGCEELVHSDAPGGRATPTPIFVGGTGLYFEALTRGLAPAPIVPEATRAKWRSFGTPAELHAELARRDPVMAARLRPTDPQRLIRALEVIDATGASLASFQARPTVGLIDPANALRIVLAPDRSALRRRFADRLDAMAGQGAVEEAARLAARGLDPTLPAMKAIGVAALAAQARGDTAFDEAMRRTSLETGRYAKRQSTWFRNRMADWLHVAPAEALETAFRQIERRGVAGAAS